MSKRKRVFVHYGADKFDPKHQYEVWTYRKPTGLWASAEKAQYGWAEWCESEFFHPERLKKASNSRCTNQQKFFRYIRKKTSFLI